jgi:glycerol-3-phosphate O-acyltransferase
MRAFLSPALYDQVLCAKDEVATVDDFQAKVIWPVLKMIEQASITRLTASGLEGLQPEGRYLFISNHRDIVLDSAYLNTVLFENGYPTSQIAIGDNLMRHRISELIFKLNKSFVVRRSGTPMELYRYSVLLSEYIYSQISSGGSSVWIAQREGRAKDGNDLTQTGLLKMLSLCGQSAGIRAHFESLQMRPVTISYEYDPCDLLKTLEHLKKQENPNYKKPFEEDLQHMITGLRGPKGRVHFHFGAPLGEALDALDAQPNAKKQLEALAGVIDQAIHRHYALHAVNYLAHDWLYGANDAAARFPEGEIAQAADYLKGKLAQLPAGPHHESGRAYFLGMYANPLINHRVATAGANG